VEIDLNKKRQSDVAGQEPETFIGGNTLEERERPNQNQFKQKAIKPAEIGTQPCVAQVLKDCWNSEVVDYRQIVSQKD
jgi:hypothetical protein